MPDVVSKFEEMVLKKKSAEGGFCYNDAQLVKITVASHFGQYSFLRFRPEKGGGVGAVWVYLIG